MKKSDLLKITCSAIILMITASCNQNKPEGDFSIVEIGKVPAPVTIEVTSDERHVMYVKADRNQKQVVFDGLAGPRFEGVYVENSFVYNPDTKMIAYSVATNKAAAGDCATCGPAGKWRTVIDNKFGPEYDKVGKVSFSKDGSKFAYAAMKRRKGIDVSWIFVLNGKELPGSYKAISSDSPMFGPDGKNLVGVVKKENDKCVVITNGEEGVEYDAIGLRIPIFSPNGKHIAYTGINYMANGATVVLDGKAGINADLIPENSLVFSPDSKHLAYAIQNLLDWQVVADGKAQKKYNQVDNIVYSPDGKNLSYKAKKGDKWTLVVNGKEGSVYDSLMKGFPVYTSDNKHLAYSFKQGGRWKVAVEEVQSRKDIGQSLYSTKEIEFDEIKSFVFSPDGKRLSFVVKTGRKKMAVIDGEVGEKYDEVVDHVVFSPDSKRAAYIAITNPGEGSKKIVIIDGVAGPECNSILKKDYSDLVFSTDSKHIAYAAAINNKWKLFIDGKPSSEPFETICNLVRSSTRGFESLVVNKSKLFRVNWNSGNEPKLAKKIKSPVI